MTEAAINLPAAITDRAMPVATRHYVTLTALDADGHVPKADGYTKLVPLDECHRAIGELEASLAPGGKEKGKDQAEVLIGSYPAREVNDPEVFVRAIASVFAETPADIGWAVVDSLTRELKWMPTRAEVHKACRAMVAERERAIHVARRHIEEHERRRKEAEAEKARGTKRIKDMPREEREAFLNGLREKYPDAFNGPMGAALNGVGQDQTETTGQER